MSDEVELRAAWTAWIGSGARSIARFEDVVGRHREPHRRYHGVRHVTWVVRHIHELAAEVPPADPGAVVAAAFFHDAVYDPTAVDNEDRSAVLAERALTELGWDLGRVRAVGDLVRATARHESDGSADRGILVDADLAVLGSEPAAYQAYVTGVRTEYGHLDDDAWRHGRTEVLQGLLARRPLYATEPARRRWEARARANLAAERSTLVRRDR